MANIEFRMPYSQRYLVLGLVGLVGLGLPLLLQLGLVGLASWLVSGTAVLKQGQIFRIGTGRCAEGL